MTASHGNGTSTTQTTAADTRDFAVEAARLMADRHCEDVRLLDVREQLMSEFSEKAIPMGAPMAMLEEVLVPIYMYHRYQMEACAKILGGVDYGFALRGAGPQTLTPVSTEHQFRALKALLMFRRGSVSRWVVRGRT